MKLQFHHAGRQFFFITIAIERQSAGKNSPTQQEFGGAAPVPSLAPAALSRLVDERSRPALLPCGEIVKALLVAMHRCFPCATISDFVIMPDHVHFLLIVDYSQDPTFSPLWATHRLMDAAEILWALWKARHPDRFIRFANIRHPVLDPARRWDAMGNLTLLASPFLHHVRLTMRKTVAEHAAEIDSIMERAVRGLVPVSGFISPGEKELLRRLKAEPQARFIKTVPFSLPPRYDPSAEDSRELAADRLLILSGFPQGTPDSRENLRARCNIMNSLAAALCSKAAEMA